MPAEYYHIEQRSWLLGAELAPQLPATACDIALDSTLGVGAAAKVERAREYFSNFNEPDDFDLLVIRFNEAALELLGRRLSDEELNLDDMVPRISRHGYLSLTTAFAVRPGVPLHTVEAAGVRAAMRIDGLVELFESIFEQLDNAGLLAFPFGYRFGVPEMLRDTSHNPLYAYGFNQHILLTNPSMVADAVETLRIDPNGHVVDKFEVMSGRTVYVWVALPDGGGTLTDLVEVVTLDCLLSVPLAVYACGMSTATVVLRQILRGESDVDAVGVRDACLVHRRMEQGMKVRERELMKEQLEYHGRHLGLSNYTDARDAYDRAEAAMLQGAEGMEAARQQSTTALANVILAIVAMLGFLTVFTAVVDFGHWLPLEVRPVDAMARRIWLAVLTLLLLGIMAYVSRQMLPRPSRRGDSRRLR